MIFIKDQIEYFEAGIEVTRVIDNENNNAETDNIQDDNGLKIAEGRRVDIVTSKLKKVIQVSF